MFQTTTLAVGNHMILAHYNGDSNDSQADAMWSATVYIGPSVELTNLTHSDGNYYEGDSFNVTVHGLSGQAVSVNQFPLGVTDGNGVSVYTNTWSAYYAGTSYSQTWVVGSSSAQPNPLTFTVGTRTQATVQLVDTTLNKSYQAGQTTYNNNDSFRLVVYGQPYQPVTGNIDGGAFGSQSCDNSGSPDVGSPVSPNTDQYGLCTISGSFSGLPPGTYSENWRVGSSPASPTLTFRIAGSGTPPGVTSGAPPDGTLPGGTIQVPYSVMLQASGGVAPYRWELYDRALPAGLTLDPSTGTISGNPSTPGGFNFSVQVQDSGGSYSVPKPLSITISNPSAPYVQTTLLPSATVGIQYSATLVPAGGSGSGYGNWTVSSGVLPPGLSLSSLPSGEGISGSPTTATGSPFNFYVTVKDGLGTVSNPQSLSIVVSPAISITEYIRLGGRVIAIERGTQ
jgi:hypothetical protein